MIVTSPNANKNKLFFIILLVIVCFLASKVLKIAETCKGKIAASEDFALVEIFFALAETRPYSKFAH